MIQIGSNLMVKGLYNLQKSFDYNCCLWGICVVSKSSHKVNAHIFHVNGSIECHRSQR